MNPLFNNEKGSALILTLLMIVLLSVIGLYATQTSTMETRISRNEKLHVMAFNEAEGGTQMGKELVEQNIEERDWTSGTNRLNVRIVDPTFVTASGLGSTDYAMDPTDPSDLTTDTRRHAYFPATNADGTATTVTQPHTNLRMGSNPQLSTGSAIQMIAGYEGEGKGAAGSGAWVIYDIRSQHQGLDNSRVRILGRYRHVM